MFSVGDALVILIVLWALAWVVKRLWPEVFATELEILLRRKVAERKAKEEKRRESLWESKEVEPNLDKLEERLDELSGRLRARGPAPREELDRALDNPELVERDEPYDIRRAVPGLDPLTGAEDRKSRGPHGSPGTMV